MPPCPGTLPGCTITALYLPPPQPHRLQYYLCLNPQPHSTILRSNILGPQDSLCQYGIYHITPIHQCRGAVNHHHHTCTHTHTQPLCNSSHTTAYSTQHSSNYYYYSNSSNCYGHTATTLQASLPPAPLLLLQLSCSYSLSSSAVPATAPAWRPDSSSALQMQ